MKEAAFRKISLKSKLLAVVADSFDRTTFHRFFAECALFVRFSLLVDVAIATIFITSEVVWSRLTAKVTVDALVIHIECTSHIVFVSVVKFSHLPGKYGVFSGLQWPFFKIARQEATRKKEKDFSLAQAAVQVEIPIILKDS